MGQTPEASSRREASKSEKNEPLYLTPEEAKAKGYRFKSPPPPPDKCQFCGKENPRSGIPFGGEILFWQPFPSRCDCPEAVEYWKKYDAEQAAKKEAERIAEEQKRKRERIERLLGKSGIKKRFQLRTFDNFKADTPERQRCYKIAKRYADTFKQRYENGDGLYIEGTNGTGKTHLAAAIALQLINEGVPVICKTSTDMLLDIKKTFERGDISESAVLGIYKSADLLIIDDLGKEQCSDWSMSILYSILNDRYEDMKPTIITTNYGAEDLIRALTPKGYDNTKIVAIISRLRETSTVITMAWDDYRTTRE